MRAKKDIHFASENAEINFCAKRVRNALSVACGDSSPKGGAKRRSTATRMLYGTALALPPGELARSA